MERRGELCSVPDRIEAVVYEDRPDQLVGVKLLLASAARHSSTVHFSVVTPGAPEAFRDWVSRTPNAQEVTLSTGGATGWNVKPAIMLAMLDAGVSPVVWLDSDMIVARDLGEMLSRRPGALLTTEDWWYARGHGSPVRTTGWGLPVGRVLRRPVNTAVLRVEEHHRALLLAWQHLSADPRYVAAQALPHAERPLHMLGGQEVLGALLGSADWAGVDVEFLKRGVEIAQCFGAAGFSPVERVRVRLGAGVPAIVHAMGTKPWKRGVDGRAPAGADLSPYVALAAEHEGEIGESLPWAHPSGVGTRLADRLTGGDPVVRQLGPSVVQAAVWQARQLGGRAKRALVRH